MKSPHSLILILSSLFGLAFLPSCNEQSDSNSSSDPVDQSQSNLETGSNTVVVLAWSDYLSAEAIEGFEAATGLELDYREYEAQEECLALLESSPGEFDVVMVASASAAEWAELRLLQPLDHAQLPNLKNIEAKYLNLDTDPDNVFTAPYLWGTTLVTYRKDLIQPKSHSWDIFLDPRVKGKALLLDDPREVFAAGMLLNGHSPNSEDQAEYEEALATLKEMVKENEIEFGDHWDNFGRLISEETDLEAIGELERQPTDLWVMQCYSGDAAFIALADPNIEYFIPEEGAPLWMDNWTISRDSRNIEAAHKFINHMLSEEAAAQNSNYLAYATPNGAAMDLIDPEVKQDPVVFPPPKTMTRCEFYRPRSVEIERREQVGMRQLVQTSRLLPVSGEVEEDAE